MNVCIVGSDGFLVRGIRMRMGVSVQFIISGISLRSRLLIVACIHSTFFFEENTTFRGDHYVEALTETKQKGTSNGKQKAH